MSGILSAFVGGTYSAAPVNSVAPVVSGTATFGQTLSCTTGTWTGVPTPTYTYQWQRVTTPISGATSSTYVLVQADVGSTIRCVVTATNSIGSASANSNSTATVAATVPGAPTIGTATATGSTTATVTYTAPASNGGATITTYTATSSPGGITGTLSTSGSGTITVSGLTTNTAYTFTVTATNSIGTSAASSASNSVTPVPSGFLATLSFAGYTTANAIDVAVNSSGTIYAQAASAGGTGQFGLLQFSSTGTNNWKRYGYVTSQVYSIATDSSNNYYVFGQYNASNRLQLTKYNSSDVLQWSVYWNESTSYLPAGTKPFIDSSGNVYVGVWLQVDAGCCTYNYYYVSRKIDSSGNTVSADTILINAGNSNYGNPVGVAVDSSGNIYNVAIGYDSGYSNIALIKSNSSFANVARKAYFKGAPSPASFEPYVYAFDVTNTVGYIAGYGSGSATVTKHDSALAVTWCYRFTGISYLYGIALDSSGNIYAVGYGGTSTSDYATRIVKLNSSGSLQWARTIYTSIAASANGQGSKISVSGNKFTLVATIVDNAGNAKPFVFSAPTDGSGTGTISNGGYTWTYASYSTSLTSVTMTDQGTVSQGSYPFAAGGSVTPTVTTASNWSSTTTQF